jgi:hypothetical protein
MYKEIVHNMKASFKNLLPASKCNSR